MDGTLFTRPFLPLWVGGAGAQDHRLYIPLPIIYGGGGGGGGDGT